jgi:hypothetical protein
MRLYTHLFLAWLLVLCLIQAAAVFAQVSTNFDTGLEGWQVTGDNSAAWEDTTGNPGGCLSVNDWATGPLNFAVAPTEYHGDWGNMTASDSLSAEIFHSSSDPDDYPPEYIFRIAGPAGAAHVFSGPSYQPVKDVWNRYAVALDSTAWTIESGTWSDIVGAVNSLRVMGEFTTGPEICRIDNVNLTSTPSYVYIPCVYDDFNDGDTGDWSFAETDGATNPGNTGNGGGFVEIDDGTGISKAFAPTKFLGDWSSLDNNGYLTIDLRIISRPSTDLGIGEFIRISGPGGTAHVDLDPDSLPESKLVWKSFVYPLDSGTWTLDSGTWTALLSNVTECRITVEFFDGAETIGFDNFGRLENSCPQIDYPIQIHDPDVSDCGYHSFVYIASVALNPKDGLVYGLVTSTPGSGGGLYPVTGPNPGNRIQSYDRPVHLIFDTDGDAYISENYDGEIHRLEWLGSSSLWVSGFHGGEPDPCGMAFAPPGFDVAGADPGDILVVDEGLNTNAYDEIWAFSPDSAEGEQAVFYDYGDFDYTDIATGRNDSLYYCDSYNTSGLYTIDSVVIGLIPLSLAIDAIVSVVYDEVEHDLYIASAVSNAIYSVEVSTGNVDLVADGFANFLRCCLEIDTVGRRLWVTDNGYSRVYSLCLEDCSSVTDSAPGVENDRRLRILSNPVGPTATIVYSVPAQGHVDLRIHDVSGRLVRNLVNDFRTAGEHSEIWDGTSSFGQKVASGIYFIQLATGEQKQTRKMVLSR